MHSSKIIKCLSILLATSTLCSAFTGYGITQNIISTPEYKLRSGSEIKRQNNSRGSMSLHAWGDDNDDEEKLKRDAEEARIQVLESRRKTIRSTLRAAESLRNFRIENDFVPEINEETGKPIKSDSKAALTFTAFVVAAGAVTLRVGGRAALVSGLGLDFVNGNPELKENMDQFLNFASSLGDGTEALLFVLAWTLVKVSCFDAGAIVLALSSGILFGGVLQGAFFSAFAATFGSSVAYFLAKTDSPIRKKALEIVEEYPSLRGIEKVVAEEGLKAVLTLRLAPILPGLPIGAYNYIYGVTDVRFFDFAIGIFLGSFKPYLLDSYLGYFGKEIIDGGASDTSGLQDGILLVALGVSVLIGVFASQLAGETWESVTAEIEAEKQKKEENGGHDEELEDDITRSLLGIDLPEWMIGAQIATKEAEVRMEEMIQIEYNAAVWNCTEDNPPPVEIDPAKSLDSPEVAQADTGFDVVANICDGWVLSPSLIKAYFQYGDPLYDGSEDSELLDELKVQRENIKKISDKTVPTSKEEIPSAKEENLEKVIRILRYSTETRLRQIEYELDKL
mmetsp:Transcript_15482/g.18872  ORF Transcript_15482/g.18872 Transcript_15482/m.18872 type:complete len:564 (-) Transcript_15482:342-2033(-)